MKKFLRTLFVLAIMALAGYLVFTFLITRNRYQAYHLIPENAIFVLETDEPLENWEVIRQSAVWNHMSRKESIRKLTEDINAVDSVIENNKLLFKVLGSRSVWLSVHPGEQNRLGALIIMDLQRLKELEGLKKYANSFLGESFTVTERDYQGHEILEVFSDKSRKMFYLSVYENLLLLSFDQQLLEASLSQAAKNVLSKEEDFLTIRNRVAGKDMFRFTLHHEFLEQFLSHYLEEGNTIMGILNESLNYTAFSFRFSEEGATRFEGYSNLNNSVPSYLGALMGSGKGSHEAPSVVPDRTAIYVSLGIDDFPVFHRQMNAVILRDENMKQDYLENKEKLEKKLNLSLEEDFISWIDDEVALVLTLPDGLGASNEFLAIVKSKDRQLAEEKLAYINEQVRKNMPVRFNSLNYKGYTINYLSMTGILKIFLGKLFTRLDKPYYTQINEFVIFSNHPTTLKYVINDYLAGRTLENDMDYYSFKRNFNDRSNLLLYINTPLLYKNLEGITDPEIWQMLYKNKEYITCFTRLGFQLEQDGDLFKSTLMNTFNPSPVEPVFRVESVTEEIPDALISTVRIDTSGNIVSIGPEEIFPDDLSAREHREYYPDGSLHFEVDLKDGLPHGRYKEYNREGTLILRGRYREGKKDRTWRVFDHDGKLIEKVEFEGGNLLN